MHRRPSVGMVRQLVRRADFYFQSNLGLRTLLPACTEVRKTVILHQTYFQQWGHRPQTAGCLKWFLTAPFTNLAISQVVARQRPRCRDVVGNLYDDATFPPLHVIARDLDLVFVGQLVSDKAVDRFAASLHGVFAQ